MSLKGQGPEGGEGRLPEELEGAEAALFDED